LTGSILCLIANLGSGISANWPQLLFSRLILGLGLGINASTVSVWAAESAPKQIRGGLAVSWQQWTAFGIFLGFVANAAVYNVS
jgi:MFS family permease